MIVCEPLTRYHSSTPTNTSTVDRTLQIMMVWRDSIGLPDSEPGEEGTELMKRVVHSAVVNHLTPSIKFCIEPKNGKKWFRNPDVEDTKNFLNLLLDNIPGAKKDKEWRCKWWVTWRKDVRKIINHKRNTTIYDVHKNLIQGK